MARSASKRKGTDTRAEATTVPSVLSDADIPQCTVSRDGSNLRILMRTAGLLAAGGLFEVVPVSGPMPVVPEEQWQMTAKGGDTDTHDMEEDPRHLQGDGINFQINVCALSAQFTTGTVEVLVEQDGMNRPIEPPMCFPLKTLAVCQSGADKLQPTRLTGGFIIVLS